MIDFSMCSMPNCPRTTDGYCPLCMPRPVYAPNPHPLPIRAVLQQPYGCICPPTSEKTCESPICPRKNHLSAAGHVGSPKQ